MADERGKGISLRKKRTVRPKISSPVSTPKQISAPMPAMAATPRPSNEAASRRMEPPRERPQQSGKTSEMVKRRYSQKITQLPTDFSSAPPLPTMPTLPSQYASASSAPPSRDGPREERPAEGRRLKVDPKALQDANLRPEQCTSVHGTWAC